MSCVVSDSRLCKLKSYLTNKRVENLNSNPTSLLSVFNISDQMYMNMEWPCNFHLCAYGRKQNEAGSEPRKTQHIFQCIIRKTNHVFE